MLVVFQGVVFGLGLGLVRQYLISEKGSLNLG